MYNLYRSDPELGACFTVFESEYRTLDIIAREKFGDALSDIPIGKAATLLRAMVIGTASIPTSRGALVTNPDGSTLVSGEMDGPEAAVAVTTHYVDESLSRDIRGTGKMVIHIIADDDPNQTDAQPINRIEYVSHNRRNAEQVINSLQMPETE